MNKRKILNKKRDRRKNRTRSIILGTAEKPRLSVFKSNKYIYVQLIDDQNSKTLVSASTRELSKMKDSQKESLNEKLGELIAKKAVEKGIKKGVFDRGAYKYHGRIKLIAENIRKNGLNI